jgi:two-component system chemotaxis response regulator CheY
MKGSLLAADKVNCARLMHAFETTFNLLQTCAFTPSTELVDVSLQGVTQLYTEILSPTEKSDSLGEISEKILRFSGQTIPAKASPESGQPALPAVNHTTGPKESADSLAGEFEPLPGTDETNQLRILIVEDDFVSRKVLMRYLEPFGDIDIAVNGKEAIEVFRLGWASGSPYDLVCLDILMPELDGREALKAIREEEEHIGAFGYAKTNIIMTSRLHDPQNIIGSFRDGSEGYLVKPIERKKLRELINKLYL